MFNAAHLKQILQLTLTKCAAQVSDRAYTLYLGPIGAEDSVKMVHNGIEYGDMQVISEAQNESMAKKIEEWNNGDLELYLIEIIASILAKTDDITRKGSVVDYVLEKKGHWLLDGAGSGGSKC